MLKAAPLGLPQASTPPIISGKETKPFLFPFFNFFLVGGSPFEKSSFMIIVVHETLACLQGSLRLHPRRPHLFLNHCALLLFPGAPVCPPPVKLCVHPSLQLPYKLIQVHFKPFLSLWQKICSVQFTTHHQPRLGRVGGTYTAFSTGTAGTSPSVSRPGGRSESLSQELSLVTHLP